MEGHFETAARRARCILFGMPDRRGRQTRLAIEIPHLAQPVS